MSHFVAVDLGASSGRLMVGHWDGRRFSLDELHRFPNSGVSLHGSLYWDALRIWSEIQNGLIKFRARFPGPPAGIAVDAWGVDFALLDGRGRLLDNPSHYRDPRTNGIPQRLFQRIPEADLFAATGVQSFQYNTLFQLYSMVLARDPRLESAETLLMVPDLFNYFLGGAKAVEFTEASTAEMVNHAARDWHRDLLRALAIPDRILPPVVAPATVLSDVGRDLLDLCGFSKTFPVIAVASHDTASAVASIPNLDAHSAFISSGTWSLMGVELDAPVATPRARQLRFTNEGGCGNSTLLLRNLTGLWLLQECLRQWENAGPRLHLGRPHRRRRRSPALPLAHPSRCPRISRARGHAPGHSLLLPIHRPARARIRRRLRPLLLRGPQPLLLVHARRPALPHRARHSHPPRRRRRLLESISLPDDSRRLRM